LLTARFERSVVAGEKPRSGSSVSFRSRRCEAGGYRLAGEQLDHACCRHLHGSDRLLTVWPDRERTVVILVAPHIHATGDVYDQLLRALGIDMPSDERDKASCCDETSTPPVEFGTAEAITEPGVAADFYRNFYRISTGRVEIG